MYKMIEMYYHFCEKLNTFINWNFLNFCFDYLVFKEKKLAEKY